MVYVSGPAQRAHCWPCWAMLAARLLPSDLGYLVQSEWPWAYIRDRVVGHLRAPCQGTGPHSAAGPAPGHFNTGDSTFQLPVQACTLRARCSDETKRLPSPSPAAVMWPGVARIRFPHRYLPWAGIWLLEHNHVAFHMLAGVPTFGWPAGQGLSRFDHCSCCWERVSSRAAEDSKTWCWFTQAAPVSVWWSNWLMRLVPAS